MAPGKPGATPPFYTMVAAPQVIIPKFAPKEDKGFWERLMRDVQLGFGLEKLKQREHLKRLAASEQGERRKTVDGLGQLKAIIPMDVYLRWDQAERGCWSSKKFKREFYRDNPEVLAARPDKKYY